MLVYRPEAIQKSAYSKSALWGTLLTAFVLMILSLGPFSFREAYGRFLIRHIKNYGTWYAILHSLMHILAFGLLGGLASMISNRWLGKVSGIAAAVLLGVVIEWLQFSTRPGSRFETLDLSSDTVGICLAALVVCAWSAGERSRC